MINESRLLEQFLEFIRIDSETGNERAMGERLVKECEALGLEVHTDEAGKTYGSNGFNVFARLEGTMEGEPYLLSAHMDTVKPGIGVKPVIEDGVRICANATVFGGITIGKNAIVGAGAVVFEDVPPYSSVAGNPARVIKQRKAEHD